MASTIRFTKIVATLGPATEEEPEIRALLSAGCNVVRINASHGSAQWREMVYNRVRKVAADAGLHVGVLLDLAGPKIRADQLCCNPIPLEPGETVSVMRHGLPVCGKGFSTTFPDMIDDCHQGQQVLLDDGALTLRVEDKLPDRLVCRVIVGGFLRQRKGINLPQTEISSPALTEKDREDLAWGMEAGVDYVGLSFVRRPEDILQLREILDRAGSAACIVAKIEKPQAVEQIERILCVTDAIMVARGDLGVEMPVEEVPLLQKQMIRLAQQAGKPVITATQMLQSMIDAASPTRAEVSDVANSILDGTDAIMLSGETAVGAYPMQSVAMMDRVANLTEDHELEFGSHGSSYARQISESAEERPDEQCGGSGRMNLALARASMAMVEETRAAVVVVLTHSGATALAVSKQRPTVPIVAVSDCVETCRRVSLYRGVAGIHHPELIETNDLRRRVEQVLLDGKWVEPGATVVIISGQFPGKPGSADMLQVHRIR